MAIGSRPSELIRDIADLVRNLQQQAHLDLHSVLTELTVRAVNAMPGAEYAGITLVARDGKVRTPSSTGRCPALLDQIQQRRQQGPCLSAAWHDQVVKIEDIEQEGRWPYYCKDAVQQTPIRSVISFQVFADHSNLGALNFYAEAPHAFDEEASEMGFVLASHVAVAWNLVRRDEQFQRALASRDIIGQAKGMVMERFKIDALQAFELLKRLSQSSNTPLAAVAHQVVESEHLTR